MASEANRKCVENGCMKGYGICLLSRKLFKLFYFTLYNNLDLVPEKIVAASIKMQTQCIVLQYGKSVEY